MEYFPISKTETGVHIEGFPNAVKVIQIGGYKAKRLADLGLHKSDLEFAAKCLEEINCAPDESRVVRQALWRSAIVHYLKCFGSGARFQLHADKIYKGDTPGLSVHNYFLSLRNKHVVHDENSYAQCIPGAILNSREHNHKITKIICFNAIAETLCQDDYSNLHLLIQRAKAWVIGEFDRLCEILTRELETESYDDLYNREATTYKVPKVDEIDKKRPTP